MMVVHESNKKKRQQFMYYVVLLLLFSVSSYGQDAAPHLEAGGVDIYEVTGANIQEFTENKWTILEFYSPICGLCLSVSVLTPQDIVVNSHLSLLN
jgi:hypothetical protein